MQFVYNLLFEYLLLLQFVYNLLFEYSYSLFMLSNQLICLVGRRSQMVMET